MLLFQRADQVLLIAVLIARLPVCFASSLDVVCESVKQLGECKARINVPTLALKTCDQDFFKVDPCKTRYSGRYPCGVSWRGVKWCDGWTCVPGTVKTVIRVPCGVDVGSKPLDLCEMALQTIPAIKEVTRLAAGYCQCLPKVLDFVDLDTVKSLVTSLDLGDASADILQKYGDAQVCMIDNGFNIQDNKEGLSANDGALVQTDSQKVFTAAEIDLSRYISLATALATCIGGCDVPAIEGVFTDYLTDSETAMSQQIQDFLTPWKEAFSGIKGQFDELGNDLNQINAQLPIVGKGVKKIADDFCANFKDCINTNVVKLHNKVDETIKSSKAFIGLQKELKKAVANVEGLFDIVNDAIVAFDTLADLGIDNIVQKVIDKELTSIEDVAELLQAAKRLPEIFGQLQRTLPNVQRFVKQLQDQAPAFISNMDEIVAESWLADPQGDEAAAQASESAVREIQSLFTDQVMAHVTGIGGGVASVIKFLQAVSVSGIPSIEVRVASYQRWSTGHFSMPCLTTGRITLSLLGYSQEVDYPKFYNCEQEYRIPFPNHHIPYVKLSFPGDSAPTITVFSPVTNISPEALETASAVFVLSASQAMVTPTDVEVDPLITSVAVMLPSVSEDQWPYISTPAADAISLQPLGTPDHIDASATEIVLSAGPAFSLPPDVYSKSEDIPAAAKSVINPSVVFFSKVNEADETIVDSVTLTGTQSFEVSSTSVVGSSLETISGNVESATPGGFQTGALTASAAGASNMSTAGPTAPGATGSVPMGGTGGSSQLHLSLWNLLIVCAMMILFR